MKKGVVAQVGELAEALPADGALVGPLAIVDEHVGTQVAWSRKGACTK